MHDAPSLNSLGCFSVRPVVIEIFFIFSPTNFSGGDVKVKIKIKIKSASHVGMIQFSSVGVRENTLEWPEYISMRRERIRQ